MSHFNKRLVVVFSLLMCLNLNIIAQKVTFNVSNVTVKQAIAKLRKATGYTFVFYYNDVNTNKVVSVKANNA
jgi:hypothetical protein